MWAILIAEYILFLLLNRLYDAGERTILVKHPSDDIGELLRIELGDTADATVRPTTGRYEYEDARDAVQRNHGQSAYEELPDAQSYVRTLIAGGLFDVANRDDIETFLRRHCYPNLDASHAPVMAGLDTNLFAFRMPAILQLDPSTPGYSREDDRPPVTGFVLSSGAEEERDWHYKHYDTRELTQAFRDEFERLTNQPAGKNRQGCRNHTSVYKCCTED